MDPLREDLRKSRLARLSGRENEMTNTASLAFGAQGRSRSYYNKLYKFNAKAELNEWELPFVKKNEMPRAVVSTARLPPIQPSVQQPEDESNDEEFSMKKLQFMLAQSKKSKTTRANKMLENLFLEKSSPYYDEIMRIKTGEEAISFFAKNGNNAPVKFLYCVKDDSHRDFRPYDLMVIKEKDVRQEYYTVSAQGIVQVTPKEGQGGSQTTFFSLSDWMHQSKMFNLLTSIKFFRFYLNQKLFQLWRNNVRYRHYCSLRKKLAHQMFFAKPVFCNSFCRINENLYNLSSAKLLELKDRSVDIAAYSDDQREARAEAKKDFEAIIERVNTEVNGVVNAVKESNEKHEIDDLDQGKIGMKNKKKSMVAEREEAEERQRMKRLAAKHYNMLGFYVRMIDYITIETLVYLVKSNVSKFYNEMINRAANIRLFNTVVKYGKDCMVFHPDCEEFKDIVKSIIDGMVSDIGQVSRPLHYFNDLPMLETHGNIPQVEQIIKTSNNFRATRSNIRKKIEDDFDESMAYAESNFEKVRGIYNQIEAWNFEEFKTSYTTVQMVKEKIAELHRSHNELKTVSTSPGNNSRIILQVDGKTLRVYMMNQITNFQTDIKNYLNQQAKERSDTSTSELLKINLRLEQQPNSLSDFVQFVIDVRKYEDDLQNLYKVKETVDEIQQILKREKQQDMSQTNSKIDEFGRNIKTCEENLLKANTYIDNTKPDMVEKLGNSIEKIKGLLVSDIIMKLDQPPMTELDQVPARVLTEINKINKNLTKCQHNCDKYTKYQETFGIQVSRMKELEEANNKFIQKRNLWEARRDWEDLTQKWYEDDFVTLDAQEIERRVNKFRQDGLKLKQELGRFSKDGKDPVVDDFYEKVHNLRQRIWVITELVKPAMKTRHWTKVFSNLEGDVEYREGFPFTFQQLIDWGVLNIKDKVEEISATAVEQYSLETTLEEVRKVWGELSFELQNYRDTRDKYTIAEIEPVMQQLEDHQVTVQTMLGNRFAQDLRGQIEEWDNNLRLVQDVIEEWLTCQKQWSYLENIFSAPDIQKQLPRENTLFIGVDRFWRETMMRTYKNQRVLESCCAEGLLDRFKKNNKVLEDIKKSLDEYLEGKRYSFPRFYFLSDEELIEILSQTRNPHTVQSHLRKCFDNMDKIVFTDEPESIEIIAMISGEKERVEFSSSVFAEGNVEHWLGKIEEMMRVTLYDCSKQCFQNYPQNGLDRKTWLLKMGFPAQCVLLIDQIMWTYNATKAILERQNETNDNAVYEFYNYCKLQINDMVEIVKGDLTGLERGLMTAMIVLDVHGRDVILELYEENTKNIHDFQWAKVLKYYWEEDIDNCMVRQTNAKFLYGYEYMGNSPRLVITPLTDKCYLTLTGALNLNYGGAPEGPAGTGKTETTKDLGKALAIQCVVFNCQSGLDVNIMSQFFSGLAQAGAWSCFDEFNRIGLEVLSVIAQQILTIQQAIRNDQPEFEFFGRTLVLNKRFGVFITMNPGYAGRSNLPDNLKALFRPVAMMIPNYAQIAEIILFSEGFENAKNLSRKMVQLYRLSSEQLSKQDHYDFGMRAVKSVLVMAGQLRRKNPDLSEDIVLIRAMRDSNVPKFLEQDLPLFRGIIKDLFPTVEVPNIDYGDLESEIRNQLKLQGFQQPDSFVQKVVQLLETMLVRHGNMLVGAASTGKTTIYKTLARALTQLRENDSPDIEHQKILYYPLNPKAITMGQLYGQTSLTGDFTDGIVPILVRKAKEDESLTKKWIVFDGPVDADWIESMNTVLDDNKMLCLTSGERIKLPDTITMLFEVADLAQASPATVSRCGMVFIDPLHLGWIPLLDTWTEQFREQMPNYADQVKDKVKLQIEQLLKFIRSDCKEEIGSVNNNLVNSCLKIISALLTEKKIAKKRPEDAELLVNLYIIFALIWSIGANINDSSRNAFDKKFKFEIETIYRNFPLEGTIYDYCIDDDMVELIPWSQKVQQFTYDSRVPYFNILVPTVDTVRYKYILEALLVSGNNILFSGQTGVGKSVIVKDYLLNAEGTNFLSCNINFSAQTSTKNIYDVLEDKLISRKRTLLGPPIGKQMIVFVDDVNMPQLDTYGAQPPVEMLRQIIEIGFYDLKKFFLKRVADTQFVACCAPPGGGRNDVTPRFFRHFNMVWQPQLSQESMETIFTQILRGFLDENPEENLSDSAEPIVKASVETYLKICNELLPTPMKSHYTFNLRDLSKVVQGILQISYESLEDRHTLILLWLHESCRVFRDRLVDNDDKKWFNTLIGGKVKEYMYYDIPEKDWTEIIFGDFLTGALKNYVFIEYNDDLFKKLNQSLDQYNAENSNQMNLVFFQDAISHLSRISRVIRQPRGNALLVGVGGSGRQSLAKLAIQMAGYRAFSIEIARNYGVNAFHEDLKSLLRIAGAEMQPIVFLFSDTQIVKESFLEDINNVLNTGEVPNLFELQEYNEIYDLLRPIAKDNGVPEGKDSVMNYFVQLVRENLHIILTFSPVGEQFRVRCRQFPSIINCCTIDWYSAWPQEALYSVAERVFESQADLNLGSVKTKLAKICVEFHTSVNDKSTKFYNELRRRNYTTPTSYLELINLYVSMLREQQTILPQKINRYKIGLQRLVETNDMVSDLKEKLIELEPILKQKAIDNEKLQEVVMESQKEVKIKEEAVSKDEAECAATMREVADIKDDCQKQLDEALPALRAANKALSSLDKKDIGEVKNYIKPPDAVEKVLNSVLILFGRQQSWDEAKKLMNDGDFFGRCLNFPKDDISNLTLRKLTPFIQDEKFNPRDVTNVSKAAGSLCAWVTAMDQYARVSRNVEPKRIKLAEAEENLRQAQEVLFEKQSVLKKIQDEAAELAQQLENSIQEGRNLQQQQDLTAARLVRAEQLVTGLGSESERWKTSAAQLDIDYQNLVGNILLSAGYVSYLGPFTLQYRNDLLGHWMSTTKLQNIKVAEDFSLENVLADEVELREWSLAGLPADTLSKDNAILITRSRRWPLIIDPQGQANKWIKEMDRETIKTIKLTDLNYAKTLETGIRFGNPVLLENVEEKLDPGLDPVLQKQIVRKGGQFIIRLGDSDVPYSNDFRFFITSKLPNPHYLPEICIKVTIINFTVTPKGLEDQLLIEVVKVERPELEDQKNKLIIQISNDKDMLKELEDKILKLISDASDNLLDDQDLINTLQQSKQTSEVINVRMEEAELTAAQIDKARESYRIVAKRGSILYFVIADMGLVDSMYQYSLEFFIELFKLRISKSQKSDDLDQRLSILIEDITISFYQNICRGLFEEHKLLYSFLNAIRINLDKLKLRPLEWAFLLSGLEGREGDPFNKDGLKFDGKVWSALQSLEKLTDAFNGLCDSITNNTQQWKQVLEANDPFQVSLPEPFDSNITNFQRLALLSVLKEEKMIQGVNMYVHRELGPQFCISPPFDLKGAFEDSTNTSPIIFVLSPGADPISDLLKLAADKEMDGRLKMLSLGQGQGKRAEKLIDNGRRNGDWVCLQNCHLATSWMGELERIQEQQVKGDIHPEYRLWLTSTPSDSFPVPVLQSGIKLTNEPPKGLRANLVRIFQDVSDEAYNSCKQSREYKRLLFSLAFFHSVIIERRKFGSIGWNKPYEWMTSDFITCQAQLLMYLNEQPAVPYDSLRTIIAEINYGGRVTDGIDVRLITGILRQYFTPQVMDPSYRYAEGDVYKPIDTDSMQEVMSYISNLPTEEEPELFGLHPNSNITFNQNTVKQFRFTLNNIHPKGSAGSGGKSNDQIATDIARSIESQMPRPLDIAREAHPETFAKNAEGAINSLGVFLGQEIERFNILIKVMKTSLFKIQLAIKGELVMDLDLEKLYYSFLAQRVPEMWEDAAYPSLKPLSSWVKDFLKRIKFIRKWLSEGPMSSYWISAFFFPQGFMTSSLQMYARQTQTPIDILRFKAYVANKTVKEVTSAPDIGINIYGAFLEGARWNWDNQQVDESNPGELFIQMPVIWLKPVLIEEKFDEQLYSAPLYKTSERRGVLTTTGHSSNFIIFLELKTTVDPNHWIRRGVALLCQLDE